MPQPTIFDREPAGFLAVVSAGVALVSAFGFHLTGEQVGAIMAFTSVGLGWWTRSKVSPVEP